MSRNSTTLLVKIPPQLCFVGYNFQAKHSSFSREKVVIKIRVSNVKFTTNWFEKIKAAVIN